MCAPSLSLRLLHGQGGDFEIIYDYHWKCPRNPRVLRIPPRTNPKLRLNLPRNSRRKFRRRSVVYRNHDHTPRRASKERRNPFGRILAPEHPPLALADLQRLQFTAKLKRHLHDLPIRKPFHPISAPLPVSALIAVRVKIRQEKLC